MGMFDNIPQWALLVGGIVVGALITYFIVKWMKKTRPKHHHQEQPQIPKEPTREGALLTMALFWWKSCGPCQNFKPTWNQLREKYEGKISFIEYEKDEHPDLMSNYQITGFPTVMLLLPNGSAQKYGGERSLEKLSAFVDGLLAPKENSSGNS